MGLSLVHSKYAPWAALVFAAVAELVHHQVLSDMLHYDCRLGGPLPGVALGIAALATIAAGCWISWSSMHGADPDEPHGHNRRFIARLGLLTAGILAVAVVWQTLATLIVPACTG